jgi:hypothetical protein
MIIVGQGLEKTSQMLTYQMFPNLNILSKNNNWWGILVQKWPIFGEQQKHTWTMPTIIKDEEQQNESANK